MHYVYDGSFDGFLCALYKAVNDNALSSGEVLTRECLEGRLFTEHVDVHTDQRKAEEFVQWMDGKWSPDVSHHLYYLYLSEEPGFEELAMAYLEVAGRYGSSVNKNSADRTVLSVIKTCGRVGMESNRLKGLIRFRKLSDGVFYAPIEPDHNVLNLLISHFKARFGAQKWMIHDLKRNTAVICNGKHWNVAGIELNTDALLLSPEPGSKVFDREEGLYQDLWKAYFKTIAIEERKNARLQKQFMPVRYWKHLIEK